MQRRSLIALAALVSATAAVVSRVEATPYASGVTTSGTAVSFILNEPSDLLTYSINGGPAQPLDGTSKGLKTFNLTAPTDIFSIVANNTDALGFTIPTGGTITTVAQGLSVDSNAGGYNLISDDTNLLTKFNSPRGVSVSRNANSPNFGSVYIANSAAGTTGGRTLTGKGLYALRSDGSDAYSYGDAAQQDAFFGLVATANTPFRTTVGPNGDVYVTGFGDALSGVWRLPPDLTGLDQLLDGTDGPTPPPTGQNHGSVTGAYVEGSLATNDLVLYTIDEDLTSAQFGGPAGDDRNSVWKYTIGSSIPSTVTPTKVNQTNNLIPAATTDIERGADGKFYLMQFRSAGNEPGIVVLNADGTTAFDSLSASRTLLGNPAAVDILRNIQGVTVSPDQKWLGVILNNSDVGVVPLIDGIPDIANRLVIDTGTDVNSGRDISFDAAGNLHYVSSGQGVYRQISPGGHTIATTSYDGTNYSFAYQTITAPVGIAGDYNNNDVVDAADYVVWRNAAPTDTLPNDPTAGVSPADYDVWRANFGQSQIGSGAGNAAVPEPASFALVAIGLVAVCGSRRRAR